MSNERPPASDNVSATNTEHERARLRRNQRNSRARKQAYVQDLEQRWNECVRLGAQATVEMQREARRVQEENTLLRVLLHKQGLDDRAIQQALAIAKQAEGNEMRTQVQTQDSVEISSSTDTQDSTLQQSSELISPQDPTALSTEANIDWLIDLCSLKDAFGTDVLNAGFLSQNNFDCVGASLENLSAGNDAQYSQLQLTQDYNSNGYLNPEQDETWDHWGNV